MSLLIAGGFGLDDLQWSLPTETILCDFCALGKGYSLRGWSIIGTGSPEKWSWHQACQSSKNVRMMLLVTWLVFRSPCEEQFFGLDDAYGSLPTWEILWFCVLRWSLCSPVSFNLFFLVGWCGLGGFVVVFWMQFLSSITALPMGMALPW